MAPNLRILIVDDSISVRKSLRRLLESLNAEFTEAIDGEAGLELALAGTFDLIITDIDHPRMNGIEFCRRLKNTPKTRGIPVIMLSSYDSDAYMDMAFHAGATAYISKYEASTYLAETVQDILSKFTLQHKRLILFVDDSLPVRCMVEDGLSKAGFQVITAENGRQALELLQIHHPDLILSDIEMPEMDGFTLCEAIHVDPELASIPFVVMSTISNRRQMQRMIQLGAADYLIKPTNIHQLVIHIDRILSDHFMILFKDRERLAAERNLIETERKLIIASISSLISALEARDAYTRGHSEVVASIVTCMATISGAMKEEIEMVEIGGKLHDIGKIGIRDNILLKEGPLTQKEFKIIKQHPVIGAGILKTIPSLSDVVTIVRYHHERPDGKGYPDGLKRGQIPLWARMTAVADTYDALVRDRPYRKGVPQEKALQIIEDARDTQLCPECVDLFLRWMTSTKEDILALL